MEPNHLYQHDFGKGKYFQVVHQDDLQSEIKIGERTSVRIVYIKDKDDTESFEILKKVGRNVEKIGLSNFSLSQMKAFLQFITELDLKSIEARKIKLAEATDLDAATVPLVKALLSQSGGEEIIETLLNEGAITSRDIVNTGFRKRGLETFNRLLEEADYWKKYADQYQITDRKEEKVWQVFFEQNQWIFGYGLDYRFQTILQREAHLGPEDLDGGNSVIADYLMGDKLFTTFVEIKKPSTPLFGRNINRSNSWTLSTDLMNSVSQILEQKASGLLRLEKTQYNSEGELITQKAYDSKVILVVGYWGQVDGSPQEKEIKKRTLELFRRDSRNVEILTYDELYERAKFIVEGDLMAVPSPVNLVEVSLPLAQKPEEEDDLPF